MQIHELDFQSEISRVISTRRCVVLLCVALRGWLCSMFSQPLVRLLETSMDCINYLPTDWPSAIKPIALIQSNFSPLPIQQNIKGKNAPSSRLCPFQIVFSNFILCFIECKSTSSLSFYLSMYMCVCVNVNRTFTYEYLQTKSFLEEMSKGSFVALIKKKHFSQFIFTFTYA